jgi:hypothetical protein
MFSQVDGFQYLAMSEPVPKKFFHRVAWAQYSEDVDIEAAVYKLDNSKVSDLGA